MHNRNKFPELNSSLSLDEAEVKLEGKKVKFQKKVALMPVPIEELDVLKMTKNGR